MIIYIIKLPRPLLLFRRMYIDSVPINFKQVFSSNTLRININPFISVNQLMNEIKPILERHFGINSDDIEIVETGQYDNSIPELAPALVPSFRELNDTWGGNLRNLAFYVRKKNQIYPQVDENRRRREQHMFISECPICLETCQLNLRYNCIHGVCSHCYERCVISDINRCSLCRRT